MTEIVVGIALAAFVVGCVALRIVRLRASHDRVFGPHLHDRVMRLLERFEGQPIPPAQFRQVEHEANQLFVDILTGVGLVPTGWQLTIVHDDLLGPMPHVVGPDGVRLTLAEFEARLRARTIELEAA